MVDEVCQGVEGASTYAEFAVLSAWARMPEGLTFEEAAGHPAVLQIARDRGVTVIGTSGAANQDYLRSLGALATTNGEGWVERVRELGRVDAALDLAGSGVIRELVELTGDAQKVVSMADLDAPRFGVRFSGVAGSVPEALAEAAGLISRGSSASRSRSRTSPLRPAAHIDSKTGHTRGRRVPVL